ncbi:MAG: NAD(P)/FAD-dependent oxidoreductase [Chloroflexota bacterium]
MSAAKHYDPSKCDIIIVGAGPAGISTALHLAQIAPELISRTLILEKSRHPRHKLCGGGLLPDGEVILKKLGLDITEVPHCDVDWAHFDYDSQGMTMRVEKKGKFAFRTIRRHEFDAWLADQARQRGFLIFENTNVKRAAVDRSGVTLETEHGTYRATVVVGADGSNSVIRRVVVPQERTHTARLLEVVTEPTPETSFHIQPDSYFDFFVIPEGILGYTWDFPAIENGKPVRVRGVYDSNVHEIKPRLALREALAEEFRRHGLDLGRYKLEGHPIRWFDARTPFSAPRLLLVGDAAGADALYGEGISLALGYGELAARAIKEAFARQDFAFKSYKSTLLHSEMGKALRRRTWIAKLFYAFRSRRIQAFFWHKLGWAIEWVVRTYLIEWAKRQEKQKA